MTPPLIWLALDGVGHPLDAKADASGLGSVWDTDLPTLRPLIDAGLALDAALGVAGLPQSGTGQSCWLTGQNAVAHMGEHFGPQPGPTLRRLLDIHGLPLRVVQAGGRAGLANFYPPAYFAAQAKAEARGRLRYGCFPYAALGAGLPLNPPDLPPVMPTLGLGYRAPWKAEGPYTGSDPYSHTVKLGERLARAAAAEAYALVALDLWLSDVIGHAGGGQNAAAALTAGREYLRRVDALLEGVLEGGAAAIVSSDHGNLEDLSVKTHTRARVPLAVAGLPHPPQKTATIVEGGRWLTKTLELPETVKSPEMRQLRNH